MDGSPNRPHFDKRRSFCFRPTSSLKNTLWYLKGEDMITHLGVEYYD
jgi:hypothetical protein